MKADLSEVLELADAHTDEEVNAAIEKQLLKEALQQAMYHHNAMTFLENKDTLTTQDRDELLKHRAEYYNLKEEIQKDYIPDFYYHDNTCVLYQYNDYLKRLGL